MLNRIAIAVNRGIISRLISATLVLGFLQTIAVISPSVVNAADPGSITFGSGSYVSAATSESFTTSGDWTLEGFYKPSANSTGRTFVIGYSGINGDVEELKLFLGPSHYWTGSGNPSYRDYQFTNMIQASDNSNIWNHFVFQQNATKACGVVQYANLNVATSVYSWPTRNEAWNCYGGLPRRVGTNNKITKWVVGAEGSMSNVRVSNIARYSFDSILPAPTNFVGTDANTLFLIGSQDSVSNYEDEAGKLTFTKTGTVSSSSNNPGLAAALNSSHSVTYNLGGGSGTLPTQNNVAEGASFSTAASAGISRVGYTFFKWNDSVNNYSAGADYAISTNDVTLTAQWTINNYAVTFSAGAHGSISGTTSQTIDHGSSSSQVTAVPDANYHFVNWSDASTLNPRTISSVETTTSLTATFAIDTYTATYSSIGNGSISGTANQTINHGESTTSVTAVPSANYHFVSWSDGVLTPTRLDVALSSSITKSASFAIDGHAVTFDANGGSGGATISVNYNENAITSAPTVSRNQYNFVGWAETVTASSISTWTVVGSKTLYSLWTPKIYTITYAGESGTVLTAAETFTVGNSPIQLQSATRAGYKFNGWYTDKVGGSLLGITGANYTPTDTATIHAQWTQASLVGLSSPTSFGTIIATSGNDGGISATRSGTKAEIDYFADSLPDNTVITAYLQGSTAYAASQLSGVTNLLLSVVVAWKAPDDTVPIVDPTKSAIRLKITNPSIKSGAKVYSIAGDSSTILTTATQDGFVVIELREDPEIVIANPVEVPAPPAPPAPTPPSITAAPIVDNSAAENAAKLKAEEEAKKATEIKAAQEQAAKDLEAAREKAEAEIKASQDAADLEAKLKAEADERLAAELKAKEDSEIAAKLASQKTVPEVTLYSISANLKLSVYDVAYLKKYVATLKPKSIVTCIGYIYIKGTTLSKAKTTASKQAAAVCKLIKAQRKSLTTKVVIYPASKAPKAATGAKWVAVSYRVDGFKS